MTQPIRDYLIKPLLMLAITVPVFSAVNVSNAEAGSREKRAAIIAGAIIGGAIGYHAYKRNKRHKRYYGNRYYRNGYYYNAPRRYYRGGNYTYRNRYGNYRYYRNRGAPLKEFR